MTNAEQRGAVGRLVVRHLLLAAALVAALVALGWVPTVRVAGSKAIPAMLVGCVVAWVASGAGTIPLLLARGRPPADQISAVMGATAVRVVVALAFAGGIALSRWLPVAPLLIWVAIAHAGLSVVDVRFAKSQMRTAQITKGRGPNS